MARFTLSEALAVAAEARSILGSNAGPDAQVKAKQLLNRALDALLGEPDPKIEKAKADKKPKEGA